jgi:hypothetical protein
MRLGGDARTVERTPAIGTATEVAGTPRNPGEGTS